MDLSIVADWLTVLFFLWFENFFTCLDKGIFQMPGGVIALCVVEYEPKARYLKRDAGLFAKYPN